MPELIPAAPGSPTWTTPDGAHSVQIKTERAIRYAACSCGWLGPNVTGKRMATQDGMDHLAKMTHPYVPVAPWDLEGRDNA